MAAARGSSWLAPRALMQQGIHPLWLPCCWLAFSMQAWLVLQLDPPDAAMAAAAFRRAFLERPELRAVQGRPAHPSCPFA